MLLEARRRITDELEKKKNELEREKSLISNSSEILFRFLPNDIKNHGLSQHNP